ncbi:MAG: hypothetical protein ACREC0_09940 [Methylocella sp.]
MKQKAAENRRQPVQKRQLLSSLEAPAQHTLDGILEVRAADNFPLAAVNRIRSSLLGRLAMLAVTKKTRVKYCG